MAKYNGEVTDELKEIYQKAYEEGIWILEGSLGTSENYYSAAAGNMKDIEELEKKLGREIDITQLTLEDLTNLSLPGTGKTREEACQNAIDAFKEYQRTESR